MPVTWLDRCATRMPIVAKHAQRRQAETTSASRRCAEVHQLARGGHPHLEQEKAKDPLEERDEEGVVGAGDRLALDAADEPNEDAAEEEVEPGVEEDLVQQLRAQALRCRCHCRCRARRATLQRHLLLVLDPMGRRGRRGRRARIGGLGVRVVAGLVRHVLTGSMPTGPQARDEVEGHQAAGDPTDRTSMTGMYRLVLLIAAVVFRTPTQVTNDPAGVGPVVAERPSPAGPAAGG